MVCYTFLLLPVAAAAAMLRNMFRPMFRPMFRRTLRRWLPVVLLVSAGCGRSSDGDDASPAQLAAALGFADGTALCSRCDQLVAELLAEPRDHPRLNARFEPFAPPSAPAEVVVVPFAGVAFPLPHRPYDVRLAYDAPRRSFDLTLIVKPPGGGARWIILLSRMLGDTPLPDVFQKVGAALPEPKRVALTRAMFGGAPNLFDFDRIAFRVAAASYSCDPKAPLPGLRDAVALNLKGLGPTMTTMHAHQDVGQTPSVLTWGEMGGASRTAFLIEYRFLHPQAGYLALSASVFDAATRDAMLSLVPHVGAPPGGARRHALAGLSGRLVDFAASPTVAAAEALVDELGLGSDHHANVSELHRYLDDSSAETLPVLEKSAPPEGHE